MADYCNTVGGIFNTLYGNFYMDKFKLICSIFICAISCMPFVSASADDLYLNGDVDQELTPYVKDCLYTGFTSWKYHLAFANDYDCLHFMQTQQVIHQNQKIIESLGEIESKLNGGEK